MKAKFTAVVRFATFAAGKIAQINGLDNLLLKSNNTITDFELYYGVSDTIPELISSSERSGYVIAYDLEPDEALEKAENFIQQIEIVYE